MSVRVLLLAASLIAAVPAFAQASDPKAAQNAANWEVFLKLYPPRALAAREEGAVGFKVTFDGKGAVTECQVTHTSGHPLLDQETCNLVTLHAEFKPEPGGSVSQLRTRDGVIAWKLPSSGPQRAAPREIADANAPEKVVCKKTVRTGTLAGFERTCMTQREWARQSDDEREMWQEVQGKKGSTSGN
jgi:periplasmic protein TonB